MSNQQSPRPVRSFLPLGVLLYHTLEGINRLSERIREARRLRNETSLRILEGITGSRAKAENKSGATKEKL